MYYKAKKYVFVFIVILMKFILINRYGSFKVYSHKLLELNSRNKT